MAEFSKAALNAAGQGCGWAWMLDRQLMATAPAFLRIRNPEADAQRPATLMQVVSG
jgi:hypothetical protein